MSTDFRAQVLQAVDLVELISQTVALKRRGKSFVGLCPFHQEKTPSFHVDPARQYFHCFGCKASGTAFDFVMKRDRVEFKEALTILARQAGIELPEFRGSSHKPGERQMLLDIHSAVCAFFEKLLSDPQAGARARAYLKDRGFSNETLKRFQVGLAPDGWDGLAKSGIARKFGLPNLLTAGLLKPRQSGDGFYDTFRGRIMFPIRNEGGQVIAFGGRVMPGAEDPAKYLNSPETPLFSKSRCAFGLDLGRQRVVETRTVAIVEGYTDVMMAHQYGATNVVSVLGTALTEQHVNLLRRFADRIVLLFDADSAGDAAADRALQLFLTQPIEIAVASIPDGLDPDEYFLKFGREAFDNLLTNAPDALSYAWEQSRRRFVSSQGDLTGQQRAVAQYLELLSSARGSGPVDTLRWGSALARVSRLTQIPMEELHRRFGRNDRPKPVRSAPAESAAIAETRPTAARTLPLAQDVAERQVLGVLLIEPQRWPDVQMLLCAEDFADELNRQLAERFWDQQRHEGEPVFNEFLASLSNEKLVARAIELVDTVEQLPDVEVTLRGALDYLAELRRRTEEQKLLAEAQVAQDQPLSSETQAQILRELQEKRRQPDLRRVRF